jgi:hypothetical protein
MVRRLRGFGRLFLDPVVNARTSDTAESCKLRAGMNMVETFTALDAAIRDGARLPEQWDEAFRFERRHRPRSHMDWTLTYPPGCTVGWSCEDRGKKCEWLGLLTLVQVCNHCHTIRRRDTRYVLPDPFGELDSEPDAGA